MHNLVDSNTHYLYDLIIDPGKNNKELVAPNKDINYAHQIILTLVKELEKGHLIIFDSWYDSINLCKDLTRMGFNYISILRNNSTDLPDKLKLANSSKKYAYNNEYHMKIRQYDDKKLINFVTSTNLNLEELKKSYNILNRGIDKMNQVISYYNIDRKSYKWWKKVFFFGIEAAISNSKIIFEYINKSNKEDNLRFRINLFSQLLTNNDEDLNDSNITIKN